MKQQETIAETYSKLNDLQRHLTQVASVFHRFLNRTDLASLSQNTGWVDQDGQPWKYDGKVITQLLKAGMLVTGHQSKIGADSDIETVAIQDAVRTGTFGQIAKAVQFYPTSRAYDYGVNRDRHEEIRDVRIAFYGGDVGEFDLAERRVNSYFEPHRICDPFERDVFEVIEPKMQKWFLTSVIDRAILLARNADPLALEVVAPFLSSNGNAPELFDAWISLATARGDVAELKLIKKTTGNKLSEVDGCIAMLHGKYDAAMKHFDLALKRVKGRSTKNAVLERLPGLFHVMLLIRENSAASYKRAKGMINVAKRDFELHYKSGHEALQGAMEFRQSGSRTETLYENCMPGLPFVWLIESWMWRWLASKSQTRQPGKTFTEGAADYRRLGLEWFAAELDGALGHSHFSTAKAARTRHEKWHEQNKTRSLFGLIEAVPEWSLKLDALSNLASGVTNRPAAVGANGQNERMVWQVSTHKYGVSIQPVIQKLTKKDEWTGGRNVALQRLHSQAGSKAFEFLTDLDRRVCQCLHQETSYGGYRNRYQEVHHFFDPAAALQALVGHSLVFRGEDTTTPIEIVQQQPKLVVTKKEADGLVRLMMDPIPQNDEDDYQVVEDTPQRIVFVAFEKQHHRLANVIGKFIDVPASEANRVVDTAQALAPFAALHSEVTAGTNIVEDANERLQLHLFPYQAGLRAEFFTRAFGDVGPFLRPGHGSDNVFANVNGQPRTARRDLKREAKILRDFLAEHPMMQQFEDDDGQFRTTSPDESLELMLELQPTVDAGGLQLHWPRGETFKVAGKASAKNFKVSIKRDRDWFAATGTLKVNEELSMDLLQLLELLDGPRARFVKLGNGQFLALTEQLRRQLDDLSSFGDRTKTKLRFPPVRAAALEDLGEAVSLKADKHWTKHLSRIHEAGELEPVVPSTMQAELRDYQVEGFQWMSRLAHWGVGGCLADDMGLGKTVQALAVLLERSADGPALVVAPTSVTFNWLAEGLKFAPTLNMHQFGSGDRDAIFKELGPRDVVITSYGMLYTEATRFQGVEWNTVVLDEAQAIKNMATKRSQAAMGLQTNFRLIMTGTPLENHLGELWNLFNFINPGLLGSWDSFRTRFALPIEQHKCRDTSRRLKKLIQPFILRRTKSQVLEELPSRTEVTLKVELSTEEAAFYEALRMKALQKLEEAKDQDEPQFLKIFAELMRLRRACCHPSMVLPESTIGSSKLALFNETIDELLDNRHKVLVFSQFVDHLSLLRAELDKKKIEYQYLDGSTPVKKRQQRVEAFQSGQGDVFLISLKAGGTGLNLTAADYVIHMDPWWNPAVEDQAADRAHRLGQTRPVTIYRLITEGTIEEKIVELHKTKRDLADSLLDGTDTSAKLSAKELLNMLRQT